MAGISKEDLQREQQKTREAIEKLKDATRQIGEFRKKAERCDKAEDQSLQLLEENDSLKKANKELTKSGAVINSKSSTFDIKIPLGEGVPQHLFTTQHGPKDWDDHYRYDSKGSGSPVDYIIKFRDGKFSDTMLA